MTGETETPALEPRLDGSHRVVVAAFGSLVTDLDHPESRIATLEGTPA